LLQLDGVVAGLDDEGKIILELTPLVPYLHRDEFEQLLGDSSLGFERTVVDLELDGGERWVWNDRQIVDHQGVVHRQRRGGASSRVSEDDTAIERKTADRYIDSNAPAGQLISQGNPTIHVEVEFWVPFNIANEPMDAAFDRAEQSLFDSIEAGRAICKFFDGHRDRVCKFGQVRTQFSPLDD
jgi:hypothetical protein